jgi:hypothetical protein
LKKLFNLIFAAIIGLTSCNNKTENGNASLAAIRATTAKKLNDYITKFQEPSQTFQVPTDKQSNISGKQGTIILINPEDLTTENGQPLGKTMEVELKELTNQNELLNSNAQTVSDGRLLVSGGAYYLNVTSAGQQLKLKEGKSLKVKFPQVSNTEMALFYGQLDSIGHLSWKQANQIFKVPYSGNDTSIRGRNWRPRQARGGQISALIDYLGKDTSSNKMTKAENEKLQKEAKLEQKVYAEIDIKSFGWINCDHFIETENKTDLYVKFDPADSILAANVYLVFKDINSLMDAGYSGDSTQTAYGFGNIPVGYKVRLVAFTVKGEKVYSYSSDITIKEKQTMTLSLKETSEEDFKKLLKI